MKPESCLVDRTGFPYLPLPDTRAAVAVLPLTKAQVELWLAEPQGPGDDWYAEMLTLSPRLGWRHPRRGADSALFLSGILPEEVERFAAWLGAGFRYPNVAEWRTADRVLGQTSPDWAARLAEHLTHNKGHPAAIGILKWLSRSRKTSSREQFLLQDGFLEWVTKPGSPLGGLGRLPRDRAQGMMLDPLSHDPIVSIRGGRNPLFSARLAYSPST